MTIELFRNNSYLKEHTSKLIKVLPEGIILDKTIFYPEGGGQPGDEGELTLGNKTFNIIGTKYINSGLVHLTENPNMFKKDDNIKIFLDWSKRYSYMQVHTCLHLLCSLIPYPVTGGSIGYKRGRLDFDLETKPNKDELLDKLNQLILKNYKVCISSITDSELDANPDLVRTMSVKPPRGSGEIRMIRIGDDVDYQPCGGTHVNSTSEIPSVSSIKIENKGKMNKRIIVNL